VEMDWSGSHVRLRLVRRGYRWSRMDFMPGD
jgi:hypothetical protein